MNDIPFLPEHFSLRRWKDPVVEAFGFPVNSVYTEAVLLPVIGPSSVLCLRRLGSWAATEPDGTLVDSRQLARDLGLGDRITRNAPIARTLNRLCGFDMAYWLDGELSVRTAVAPLPERQLQRLSDSIRQLHDTLVRRAATQRRTPGPNYADLRLVPTQTAGPEL